jgi:hypothetical protein
MWGNYRGNKRAEDMRPPDPEPDSSNPCVIYDVAEPATEAGQPPAARRCCCPCHGTEG